MSSVNLLSTLRFLVFIVTVWSCSDENCFIRGNRFIVGVVKRFERPAERITGIIKVLPANLISIPFGEFPVGAYFIFTGKILTSKFQNFLYRCPFKLFWQLPPSNGSVHRVDGCDCVNSGRARTCRQSLPSGLLDSRQATSGTISDLIRCD